MTAEKDLMRARRKLFHEYSELETLILNDQKRQSVLISWKDDVSEGRLLLLNQEEQAILERIHIFEARKTQVVKELCAQEPDLERLKMLPQHGGTCDYTQARIEMIERFQVQIMDTISEDYRIIVAKYLAVVGVELKRPVDEDLLWVPILYSHDGRGVAAIARPSQKQSNMQAQKNNFL